jgi:hypothetical protein
MRLGPVCEAVINGRYYWLPFVRLARIVIDEPQDLRDAVWMPAHFEFSNGGETVGVITTRYPGSESHTDPLVRLARKTDWAGASGGVFHCGLGQRVLATDQGRFPLMDIREIVIASDGDGTPRPDPWPNAFRANGCSRRCSTACVMTARDDEGAAGARILSKRQLRDDVKDNLHWLMNATRLSVSTDLSGWPEVESSVLNFGLPAFCRRDGFVLECPRPRERDP